MTTPRTFSLRLCSVAFCSALALAALTVAAPIERASTEAGSIFGGAVANGDWGRPLATGDLDGDGADEVIVAASKAFSGTSTVYILRGGAGFHGQGWTDLSVTTADQVIFGAEVGDNLGSSIATGDVTGDGIDDLLLVASTGSFDGSLQYRGVAYLIYGGPNFFASSTRDLAVPGTWDLRILGPVAGGDMGGSNAFGGLDCQGAAIGRLNNDIYGDIVLGVHLATGGATESGRVYVLWGNNYPSGFTFNLAQPSAYGVRIDGKARYDELGTMVCTADLTGDGIDELVLGCEWASKGLFTSDGAAYIFRGRATWPALWTLNTTPADINVYGRRASDSLGESIAVGDFNGDGLTDIAIGASGAELGAHTTQIGDGIVYGLLGATKYQTGTWSIDYASATPDFMFVGDPQKGLGVLVAAGDFNDDGLDDIAAGEWFGGPSTNGVVEVLYGRAFTPGSIYTASIDSDLRIVGAPNDRISFSLSAGDTNGDGLDEIVFGTPFNNANKGTIYVFTHVTGDVDRDGDLDLADVAVFQTCFDPAATGGLSGPCIQFDFSLDEVVNELDLAQLANVLTGPGGI